MIGPFRFVDQRGDKLIHAFNYWSRYERTGHWFAQP